MGGSLVSNLPHSVDSRKVVKVDPLVSKSEEDVCRITHLGNRNDSRFDWVAVVISPVFEGFMVCWLAFVEKPFLECAVLLK